MLLIRLKEKRKYLLIIFIVIFIFSAGLNFHNHLVVGPQMQATVNNMRVYALESWVGQMMTAKNILKNAETNFDVYDARIHTSLAKKSVQIYGTEIDYSPENLYHWLSKSTSRLDYALETIFWGNTPPLTSVKSQNLDQYILEKIESITQTIEKIIDSMRISANGVDPVQQLIEKGNLTDLINYCSHIIETSNEIIKYY